MASSGTARRDDLPRSRRDRCDRRFPLPRPGFRTAIALLFVLALVNGTLHLIQVTDGGPSGRDATGELVVVAGVVPTVLVAAKISPNPALLDAGSR